MQIDAAMTKEQGVNFTVVVVKPHVLNQTNSREDFREACSSYFSNTPIILMAQNSRGTPTYHGRPDIVKFLANIDHRRLPWSRYTLS